MQPNPTPALDPNWLNTLLMAASIGLIILAIVLTLLTLIAAVWGRDWVSSEIAKHINEQSEITNARIMGYLGFIYGQLRKINPELIERAIEFSRHAYQFLPDDDLGKIQALNNLAFYLSLQGHAVDGEECTKLARLLRQRYNDTGNLEYLNTYASVVVTYHNAFPDPEREIEEACAVLDGLLANIRATEASKVNARKHKSKLDGLKKPKKPKPKKKPKAKKVVGKKTV